MVNKAFREFDDFRTSTVEDMLNAEKSPNFDATGMFMAELDGDAVGFVNAYVDKEREEKKGFIRVLGVVPEHRRKGIGRMLAEKAVESLKERKMETVEAMAFGNKPEAIQLWENMGFKRVRVFCLMKKSLNNLPMDIGENTSVTLRKIVQPSGEDIRLVNQLENETFREHYNFRPATIEETRFFLTQDSAYKDQEWLIAYLNGSPIGYVGVGIDQKYNTEKNTKAAWILDIGVLKPHRQKGIGTTLMIEAMKLMKAKDMNEATLVVDDQNPTRAIRLYEKVGFELERRDLAYLKTIKSSIIFSIFHAFLL
jgi:mycothiol synthase